MKSGRGLQAGKVALRWRRLAGGPAAAATECRPMSALTRQAVIGPAPFSGWLTGGQPTPLPPGRMRRWQSMAIARAPLLTQVRRGHKLWRR
ncbi:hypothetical protein Psi01_35070 [Planobispora siamensis]|uniref:Uncharacterized protein n=1 Tax=Planobispora siamensis TaxID=936338 RepID=A0A8J3SH60_9ACTN|nr:hypothetical protein Psi01_35070 [Planobispora siamensis]